MSEITNEVLLEKLVNLKDDNDKDHESIMQKQDYTNGTVKKHDKLINRFLGGASVLMFILTVILIPLAFYYIKEQGEKRELTINEVQQLIDENINKYIEKE